MAIPMTAGQGHWAALEGRRKVTSRLARVILPIWLRRGLGAGAATGERKPARIRIWC